jgi:hypothetical protein
MSVVDHVTQFLPCRPLTFTDSLVCTLHQVIREFERKPRDLTTAPLLDTDLPSSGGTYLTVSTVLAARLCVVLRAFAITPTKPFCQQTAKRASLQYDPQLRQVASSPPSLPSAHYSVSWKSLDAEEKHKPQPQKSSVYSKVWSLTAPSYKQPSDACECH